MSSTVSYPLGPSATSFSGAYIPLYDEFDSVTESWVFKKHIFVNYASAGGSRLILSYKYNYFLLYWKKDFLSAFFLLFQKLNWEASVELPHWYSFLLFYCCQKRNVFIWEE